MAGGHLVIEVYIEVEYVRTIEILELLTATLIVFPFLIFYVTNDVILVVP